MVEDIEPEDLHARLEDGDDIQVIDIRPDTQFHRGHIPGATNIPFDRFARELASHEFGDEVVVACPIGESSLQAARLLESYEGVAEDTRIANLRGGYRAWEYDLEQEA